VLSVALQCACDALITYGSCVRTFQTFAYGFRSVNEPLVGFSAKFIFAETPMLITCNNCTTSYEIEPCSFGLTGRSVRCVKCGHEWFAANMTALGAIAKIHRVELGLPPEPLVEEPRVHSPENSVIEATNADLPLQQAPSIAVDIDATEWRPTASDKSRGRVTAAAAVRDLDLSELAHAKDAVVSADANTPAQPEPAVQPRENAVRPRHVAKPVTVARSNSKKPKHSWRQNIGLFLSIVVLIVVHTALVWWRTEVVRVLPQTAALYAAVGLPVNLRGLEFADVQTTSNLQDGTGLLVVEGSIVNSTSRRINVARLLFSVRDQRGLEIYNWTAAAPKPTLDPGERLPFRSRLAAPPPETHRVVVRFRNRHDLVAGLN